MFDSDSPNTTDPSAPTKSEMDAMWRAARNAELDEAEAAEDRERYERIRSRTHRECYGEAA